MGDDYVAANSAIINVSCVLLFVSMMTICREIKYTIVNFLFAVGGASLLQSDQVLNQHTHYELRTKENPIRKMVVELAVF